MDKNAKLEFQELSIDEVHPHVDHVAAGFGNAELDQWLTQSIDAVGILAHLTVMQEQPDCYTIIDGHRRYAAACKLKLNSLPCIVRPQLSPGDYECLRWSINMNRIHKPFKPAEQKAALNRFQSLLDDSGHE